MNPARDAGADRASAPGARVIPLAPPGAAPDASAPDVPTLAECFERHRGAVYRWARMLTRQHADALDLLQDAFLRLADRDAPRHPPARLLAWLRRTTHNLAVDRWRRARPTATLLTEPAANSPAERAESDERDARLHQALQALSEQQRLTLLAKECDGLTFEQIAHQLDVSASTVKTHYVRALRALRRRPELRIWNGEQSDESA